MGSETLLVDEDYAWMIQWLKDHGFQVLEVRQDREVLTVRVRARAARDWNE
jgi:hypothetical protein